MIRGTEGVFANIKFKKNNLDHLPECLKHLWKNKFIHFKDIILITTVGFPFTGNRLNMIQTHYVKDLIKSLKW